MRKTFAVVSVCLLTLAWGDYAMASETAISTEVSVKKKSNHLINEASPYLRQHAYNPVDWYPWGAEAFAKARAENKPIILSIGYSTCYWCHVMEREIFEDEEMAALMNKYFVSVKVDREERPDIDDIYMAATTLITKRGGWPNNVFLTPDLKPFYAGTYFPKENRNGQPGWHDLLIELNRLWEGNRDKVESQAQALTNSIQLLFKSKNKSDPRILSDKDIAGNLYQHYVSFFDAENGGFYQAPKFPQEDTLSFILESDKSLNVQGVMARTTLEKIAMGGIHDHVGGGFHRYATDKEWRIPHFEKMLYNQALLSRNYLSLYETSNDPAIRYVIDNVFRFVERVMTSPLGGFYSALDAETDAVEGAYYTWTRDELKSVLGDDGYKTLREFFDFESLPEIFGHPHNKGRTLYLEKMLSEKDLETVRPLTNALFDARQKRERPHLDTKIIAGWNGLMVDAYAEAGRVLKNETYIQRAEKAADFILDKLKGEDGGLYRIYAQDKAYVDGTLEDYSYVIKGLLSTYSATQKDKYLKAAISFVEKTSALFTDHENGGYFFTAGEGDLFVRLKDGSDSEVPSGNAVMVHNLLKLYEITNEDKWKDQAGEVLSAFGQGLLSRPQRYTHLVEALRKYQKLDQKAHVSASKDSEDIKRALDMDSADKVQVSVALDNDFPASKREYALRVRLDIEKGWHINSSEPPLDFLVPTTIEVRSKELLRIIDSEYPTPYQMKTPLVDEGDIPVYKGKAEFLLIIEFRHPITNPVMVHVPVRVQACKDMTCLPPADIVANIKITK